MDVIDGSAGDRIALDGLEKGCSCTAVAACTCCCTPGRPGAPPRALQLYVERTTYNLYSYNVLMYSIRIAGMVLAARLIIRSHKCNFLHEFVLNRMYISMSYCNSKYEFMGPDSTGVRVWCG